MDISTSLLGVLLLGRMTDVRVLIGPYGTLRRGRVSDKSIQDIYLYQIFSCEGSYLEIRER